MSEPWLLIVCIRFIKFVDAISVHLRKFCQMNIINGKVINIGFIVRVIMPKKVIGFH